MLIVVLKNKIKYDLIGQTKNANLVKKLIDKSLYHFLIVKT